jgi:hypothetical protein
MIALTSIASVAAGTSFHIDLGDLPTWLGVFAASVAAYFVYGQLRGQREDFARQVRALERQQADQIAVRMGVPFPSDSDANELLRSYRRSGLVTEEKLSVMSVWNASGRPIRQVACRAEDTRGAFLEIAAAATAHTLSNVPLPWMQPVVVMWSESEWTAEFQQKVVGLLGASNQQGFTESPQGAGAMRSPHGTSAQIVRPSTTCGFIFPMIWWGNGRCRVRFTDDAGLHWQIDENLHLQKLNILNCGGYRRV